MNELTGGLKNALERGDSLERAKQSFINSGYKLEEVEQAARELNSIALPIHQNQNNKMPELQKKTSLKKLPQAIQSISTKENKKSSLGTIILIISSVLILISAALLGIYWDRIFG